MPVRQIKLPFEKTWDELTRDEVQNRRQALLAIKHMRRYNLSVEQLFNKIQKGYDADIKDLTALESPEELMFLINIQTNAVSSKTEKLKGKDYVSRRMFIISGGARYSIEVGNSDEASKIGRYHSDLAYIESSRERLGDDDEDLERIKQGFYNKWIGESVTDIDGEEHYFEADYDRIQDALEGIEDWELQDIYDD